MLRPLARDGAAAHAGRAARRGAAVAARPAALRAGADLRRRRVRGRGAGLRGAAAPAAAGGAPGAGGAAGAICRGRGIAPGARIVIRYGLERTGPMLSFANPARFMRLSAALLPWCAWAAGLFLAAGVVLALFVAPPDYQQGEAVRIMYVHVPAAWMASFVYALMAGASAVGLISRHPLADIAARAAAPLGAGFTLVCLVSGSLWGEPMWGTWWVWDARLTSVLVLFFLYVGYIALVNGFDDPTRGARAGAVLALVGVVNLPIIKFSVDWWNTLHQPASVFRMGGPTIDRSMLVPLLVMAAAFMLYFAALLMLRMRTAIVAIRVRAARLGEAEALAEPRTRPAAGTVT